MNDSNIQCTSAHVIQNIGFMFYEMFSASKVAKLQVMFTAQAFESVQNKPNENSRENSSFLQTFNKGNCCKSVFDSQNSQYSLIQTQITSVHQVDTLSVKAWLERS